MSRYYFSITYLSINCDVTLLAGRCIGILHGFSSKRRLNNIGVTFPRWSEKHLGNQIAFVSDKQDLLKYLSRQNYFEMMAHDKLFEISEVQQVPENVGEVRFIRDQRYSKLFMGEKRRRMARAKRRAEARGEEYVPQYEAGELEIEPCHKIPISSKSTGNEFVLHFRMETATNVESGYNAYGFASNSEKRGTVPLLPI